MINTKLHGLLASLDVYALNRLQKFLHSPYYNEDENMQKCYAVILPALKKDEVEGLTKQHIWKAVYGKKPIVNLKYARLLSDLAKKTEEFIVADRLKHNEAEKLQTIIDYYTQTNLLKYFPETAGLVSKKMNVIPHKHGDFYYALFRFEASQNVYSELLNRRNAEKNILQTLDALDTHYFITKLNYFSALLHYKNFLAIEGEVSLINETLKYLEEKKFKNVPAIEVHYHIVQSLIEPDNEQHFFRLKENIFKHSQIFPKIAARNMFAFSINYCIRRINFGNLSYLKELFELYKRMLKDGLMTDNKGIMSQFDYKNIVTVGLRVGDLAWTEKFIRDYRINLRKAERENAFTYNMAKVHFQKREFDKVLQMLQDVKYDDIFYQLDSKSTLVKTYFELGEYFPLMSLKESFRILLRRKKVISEQNRVNYMNFLRYTMKLYRIDVKDTKKLSDLHKEVKNATNVADKGWLLEKLKELGAK